MTPFTIVDDKIVLNAPYMEAYIPQELFGTADSGSSVAYEYEDRIKLIGLFNVRIFDKEQEIYNNRYEYPLRTFNYPNMIEAYPTTTVKEKMAIQEGDEPELVRILKFYKGDIIMSTTSKHDSMNCEKYINLLSTGKIPRTIDYRDLLSTWEKNFAINDVNPGVPSVTLQVIIGLMCRNRENPLEPYRYKIGKKFDASKPMTDYEPVNMRECASYVNVMGALTFEDMSTMLLSAINMSKQGITQTKSPFEKLLTL